MAETYKILTAPGESEIRIKGSKFLGYARYVSSRDAAEQHLRELRELHPKATHHCSAWTVGLMTDRLEYSSDDGEPSGTAGRPILGAIKSAGLSYTSVISVRYYGGTKLGSSGLIRAYRESAELALLPELISESEIRMRYALRCDYETMPRLLAHLERHRIEPTSKEFTEDMSLVLDVNPDDDSLMREIYACIQDCFLDDIDATVYDVWIREASQGYV